MLEEILDSSSNGEAAAVHVAADRSSALLKRRNFLTGVAATGAFFGAGALAGCSSDGPIVLPTVTPSVIDVLNFALNLEYLEASFYLYVTTGTGLSAADMGPGAGTVSGGAQVMFTNGILAAAALQLANDEMKHVEFLRGVISAIGGTPISMPNINLGAAGTVNSDSTFLAVARQLEGVGTSAYAGGAQFLASNPLAVTYAAQILHLEAQHEGFLRELCIVTGVPSPAADSQDLVPGLSQIFNTGPTNGLSPVRTTSQVLQIVYGAAGAVGVSSGGFFPNGLNGAITTS